MKYVSSSRLQQTVEHYGQCARRLEIDPTFDAAVDAQLSSMHCFAHFLHESSLHLPLEDLSSDTDALLTMLLSRSTPSLGLVRPFLHLSDRVLQGIRRIHGDDALERRRLVHYQIQVSERMVSLGNLIVHGGEYAVKQRDRMFTREKKRILRDPIMRNDYMTA